MAAALAGGGGGNSDVNNKMNRNVNEQKGGSSSSSRTSSSSSFKPTQGLRYMKTREHSFAFEEVEADIWFALAIKHPVVGKKEDGSDEVFMNKLIRSTSSQKRVRN